MISKYFGKITFNFFLILLFLLPLSSCKMAYNYIDRNAPFWYASNEFECRRIPDSTLTVVSFNIQYGELIDEAIAELNTDPFHQADIILLQEMDENGIIYLSEQMEYNYLYFPMSYNSKFKRNFGNAILSKWPIQQPEKIILPHAQPLNSLRRGVTSAIVQFGDIDIKTYSIHLETPVMSRAKRLQQLEKMIDNINTQDHSSFIIAGGDFNSLYPQDVTQMVDLCMQNNLEWNTECVGHTLTRFNFIKPTLDHIFSRGFTSLDAGKKDGSTASDHSPIWTKLKII